MKKHNFYAGPSIMSQFTIEETAKAVHNFADMGLSILEISHRSKQFQAVMDETVALFKELLEIPEGYSVLFLGGGASLQFAMVPMNMLSKKLPILTQVYGQAKQSKRQNYLETLTSLLLPKTKTTPIFQKTL